MIGSSVSELHSSKHHRPIWYVTRNRMQPSQNPSPRKKLAALDLRSDDKIRSWSGGLSPSHLNQQRFTHTSERSQPFLHSPPTTRWSSVDRFKRTAIRSRWAVSCKPTCA